MADKRKRPGGFGEPGPGGAQPRRGLPEGFTKKLGEVGLRISKNGNRIEGLDDTKGGTPEQLALIQQGYNQFGLDTGGAFNPRRFAFDPGTGKLADLTNGLYSGGGMASDDALELMRLESGYDPLYPFEEDQRAQQYERQVGVDANGEPIYETFTPAAFRTAEAYEKWKEASRKNYQAPVTEKEMFSDYAGLADLDDDQLGGLSDAASNLLQSRQKRQRATSFYGDYFQLGEEA